MTTTSVPGAEAPEVFGEFPSALEMIAWMWRTASGYIGANLALSVAAVAALVIGYFGWVFVTTVRSV